MICPMMEGHLYQINRLIDDKDQLVAEKNDNLQSHHHMWRELAAALKQKDAQINDLIAELWQRSTESVETTRRQNEQIDALREDHDRRTDLLELKLQRLEAAHAENMSAIRWEHGEKVANLQLKLDGLRRDHKIEMRALIKKNRDLQTQLKDANRQLEEQDEEYFKADGSIPDEYLDPSMFESSTAPFTQPSITPPAEHNSAVIADERRLHNADNVNTVITQHSESEHHSDSEMDEIRDFSSDGTLSDSDSSDV
jgi:hypothetical protein